MSTSADQQRSQQQELWSTASAIWEKYDAWMQPQMEPVSRWLCDAAAIAPGQRVLDLACGTGQPASTIAARVGPTGHVVATDFAAPMVAATARTFARLGLTNVEAREMDAEQLGFPDGTFAAVTCRFGLMFCPDPARAAAEIARVLRPGGRVAVAVWDEAPRNPYFTAVGEIVGRYMVLPPLDPQAPNVFRLAPPGALAGLLTTAGLREVRTESLALAFTYSSPEAYWEIQHEIASSLRTARATLSPERFAALRDEVIAMAGANIVDGEIRFAATPLCATAVR